MRSWRRFMGGWLMAILGTTWWGISVWAADAGEGVRQAPEQEGYLLEVRLDALVLGDVPLPAYRRGEKVLVPLGQLARLLELDVQVEPGQGRAEGTIGRQRRRFRLDVPGGTVVVGPERASLDPAGVRLEAEDIYADVALLSRWLPVDLTVDAASQVLHVRPREPLPVQLRLEREKRWEQLRAGRAEPVPLYPHAETPYRLAEGPFVDSSLTLTLHRDAQGQPAARVYPSMYASAELLYLNGAFQWTSSEDTPASALRFTLGRQQPEPTLLGPLKAREFWLGDLTYPTVPLVSDGEAARGITVSNFPVWQPDAFDRIQLQGPLPAGWSVELYRDGVLLDVQESRQGQTYRFEDIPLRYGDNELRLVFYGPQGQVQEQVRRFYVGDELVPPGQRYYRLSVGQTDSQTTRAVFRYEQGFSRRLSAGVGLARDFTESGDAGHAVVSLRSAQRGSLVQADVAVAEGGGLAGRLALHKRWNGAAASLEHTRLTNYTSRLFPAGGDPIESRTRLAFQSASVAGAPGVPVTVEVEQDRLGSGRQVTRAASRISFSAWGFGLTHWLQGSVQDETLIGEGTLWVSRTWGRYTARTGLSYGLEQASRLRQVAFSLRGPVGREYTLQLQALHSAEQGTSSYAVDVIRQAAHLAASIGARYATGGAIEVRLSLTLGLGREPRQGSWWPEPPGSARQGAISARAFLDANGNGTMDADEIPLPGVAFRVNGHPSLVRTDPDGIALLAGLPPHRLTIVEIDPTTLEHPAWRPASDGLSTRPRPGAAVLLDFPVAVSGEVSGFAYLELGKTRQGVSDVELELVDANGQVVRRTRSGFDGFFVFEGVRPGQYTVRIAPDQASKLGLDPAQVQLVQVPSDGLPVDGLQVVARRLGDRPAPGGTTLATLPPEVASPARADQEPKAEGIGATASLSGPSSPPPVAHPLRVHRETRVEEAVALASLEPRAVPPHGTSLPEASPPTKAEEAATPASLAGPEDVWVRVRLGDTLFQIARDFGIPVEALIRSRPGAADPNHITPGEMVRIPGRVMGRYVVRPGDTLFSIARTHGVPVAALRRLNPELVDADRLVTGQVLRVAIPKGRPYKVRLGDTLFSIARAHGLSLDQLLELNPQIAEPHRIEPGQTVWVAERDHA